MQQNTEHQNRSTPKPADPSRGTTWRTKHQLAHNLARIFDLLFLHSVSTYVPGQIQ